MPTRPTIRRIGLLLIVSLLLAACNLGEQSGVQEPITQPLETPTTGVVPPLDTGGQPVEGASPTPLIEIPPTNTPVPELLPWETLGPISVDGTEHRAQEPVTIRVKRGRAVSNITCSWVLQDTNQTAPLGTSTATQLDENTFEEVFTFTPETAGTYSINCTGIATTTAGPRAVNATGTPFSVQAKG